MTAIPAPETIDVSADLTVTIHVDGSVTTSAEPGVVPLCEARLSLRRAEKRVSALHRAVQTLELVALAAKETK